LWPLLTGILLALTLGVTPLHAQAGKKRADRGGKPGEVITRPDMPPGGMPKDHLEVGQAAPEFTLPSLTKKGEKPAEVSLKELRAKRPVVLIFGSMTCPPFKKQLSNVDEVYQTFRDRAEFLMVYVREAHPDSVLYVKEGEKPETLRTITQPKTLDERITTAMVCQQTLALGMPMAVDRADNAVQQAYSGWPNRMVVVGTDGAIRFKSPIGPSSTNASTLRAWLQTNLK
jgi:hypothetical protein